MDMYTGPAVLFVGSTLGVGLFDAGYAVTVAPLFGATGEMTGGIGTVCFIGGCGNRILDDLINGEYWKNGKH